MEPVLPMAAIALIVLAVMTAEERALRDSILARYIVLQNVTVRYEHHESHLPGPKVIAQLERLKNRPAPSDGRRSVLRLRTGEFNKLKRFSFGAGLARYESQMQPDARQQIPYEVIH